jgi:hypothetical protein
MMRSALSLALVLLPGLLLLAVLSCGGAPPGPGDAPPHRSSAEERVKAFTWFGTLGFPDVKGRKFVRAATGESVRQGDEPPQNTYVLSFLLDNKKDSFVVFTPALSTLTLHKTKGKVAAHEWVGYEEHDLAAAAAAQLKALRDLARSDKPDFWRRFGEQLTERTEVFVLAWACWRNGLDGLAAELYDHAAGMEARVRGTKARARQTLQQAVADDIAHKEMWQAVLDFEDPAISRAQLLERFERIVRNYPDSEHVARARETAALLRQMGKEDAEHAARRKAGKPFEQLSKTGQIADLIFQLRDQNGHQRSQPGWCDIFDFDFLGRQKDTPAHQLVKFGYDAVPQLIDVLEDKRFTRSVGFHRDFYFSHYVLRVGDAAQQILERIAGRSFYERRSTSGAMVKDGAAGKVKEQVKAWYAELQKKGEKRLLEEATLKGDDNSPRQGKRLLERHPEAALAALVSGAKASRDSWVRAKLVQLVGEVRDDACLPFLLAELKDGPFRDSRLAAARGLHGHGRPEGVSAMIAEWEGRRPVPSRLGGARQAGPPRDTGEELEPVVEFLASCGKVEAIEALGKDLRRRPVDLRGTVVSAFREAGDQPERVRAAIEQVLVSALDDTDECIGLSGSRDGKEFADPRVCDLAGHELSQLTPDRYLFDLFAPLAEKDRARVALQNVWRRAHGQAPLPLPPRKTIAPAREEELRPLLDQFLRGPEAERARAERQIEQLGVGALPGVLRRSAGTEGSADRTALERLARRLACLVTDVVVAEESLPPDEALAARFGTLKHRPFDPKAFLQTVDFLVRHWPRDVHGVRLAVDRAGDCTGMTLTVDLLDEARASLLGRSGRIAPGRATPRDRPSGWDYSERVQVGRKHLHGVQGGGEWSGDHADLRDALSAAGSAGPREPIEIRIQLIAEWAN